MFSVLFVADGKLKGIFVRACFSRNVMIWLECSISIKIETLSCRYQDAQELSKDVLVVVVKCASTLLRCRR